MTDSKAEGSHLAKATVEEIELLTLFSLTSPKAWPHRRTGATSPRLGLRPPSTRRRSYGYCNRL